MTIVAIVFASLDLRGRLASVSGIVGKQLEDHRSAIIKLGKDRGLDDASCNELFGRVSSEINAESSDVVENTKRRLLIVELIIFIVGTLIWGFGDLPVDALLSHFCGRN